MSTPTLYLHIGPDPAFDFPFPDTRGRAVVLTIAIEPPAPTELQIFLSHAETGAYSEKRSLIRPIGPGPTVRCFWIPPSACGSRLRIDPGCVPGRYRLTELTIQSAGAQS